MTTLSQRLGIVAALAIAAGGSLACGTGPSEEPTANPLSPTSTLSSPSATLPPRATPTPATVTLAAVGDLMLGRSIGYRIEDRGPSVVFDDAIRELLAAADITAGNLECAVSDLGYPQPKGYTFQAPLTSIGALTLAGFDVVSQANNHAMDYGRAALLDSSANLRADGIQTVGAGPDLTSASAATVIERNGLRIAFVGLVDAPAEGPGFSRSTWEATDSSAGVAWADTESVTAAVREAAHSADVVVAFLHFGIEYATAPSGTQRALAHAAVDAGASVVLGSHPHVLQEVEEYKGGLIAYSLGNFVFDGFEGSANDSAILQITLSAEGVENWDLVPVDIVENGLPRLTRE